MIQATTLPNGFMMTEELERERISRSGRLGARLVTTASYLDTMPEPTMARQSVLQDIALMQRTSQKSLPDHNLLQEDGPMVVLVEDMMLDCTNQTAHLALLLWVLLPFRTTMPILVTSLTSDA